MGHKKRTHHGKKGHIVAPEGSPALVTEPGSGGPVKLELVVKADTVGTLAAVTQALGEIDVEGVDLEVIQEGIGDVSKSDLLMALTGSHLVVGFDADVMPKAEEFTREKGVEVRLFEVIYDLTRDMERVAGSLIPGTETVKVIGQAKVIALFKSTRKGIILGCEVTKGKVRLGQPFRVMSAMGPAYEGVIESLKIETAFVKTARVGQQVGLKIQDFKDAHVGDLVECLERVGPPPVEPWAPRGGALRPKG